MSLICYTAAEMSVLQLISYYDHGFRFTHTYCWEIETDLEPYQEIFTPDFFSTFKIKIEVTRLDLRRIWHRQSNCELSGNYWEFKRAPLLSESA